MSIILNADGIEYRKRNVFTMPFAFRFLKEYTVILNVAIKKERELSQMYFLDNLFDDLELGQMLSFTENNKLKLVK